MEEDQTVSNGKLGEQQITVSDDSSSLQLANSSSSASNFTDKNNFLANVIKDGYLNQKTDHYRLPGTRKSSAGIGKTWRVYRSVLRGTRLYFFKPFSEGEGSELKSLFPTSQASPRKIVGSNLVVGSYQTNSSSIHGSRDTVSGSFTNSFEKVSLSTSTGGNLSNVATGSASLLRPLSSESQTSSAVAAVKIVEDSPMPHEDLPKIGLVLIPSMFDAATRLLLFSNTVVPSSRYGAVSTSSINIGPGEDQLSSSLMSKYLYGDVFIELDSINMKFKSQLVLLVFDDRLMILAKKWVRITRSVERASESTTIKNARSFSNNLISTGGKMMDIDEPENPLLASSSKSSELTVPNIDETSQGLNHSERSNVTLNMGSFDRMNFHNSTSKTVTKLTFDLSMPLSSVFVKVNDSDTMEVQLSNGEPRIFRARNKTALVTWVQRFSSAQDNFCKRQSVVIAKDKMELIEVDGKRGTGVLLVSPSELEKPKNDPYLSMRTNRRFWGVGRHPELYVSENQSECIKGGSLEALIHEFIFRNVKIPPESDTYEIIVAVLLSFSSSPATGQFIYDEVSRLLQVSLEKSESVWLLSLSRSIELFNSICNLLDGSALPTLESFIEILESRENLTEGHRIGLRTLRGTLSERRSMIASNQSIVPQYLPHKMFESFSGSLTLSALLKIESKDLAYQIFVFHAQLYLQYFSNGVISSLFALADRISREDFTEDDFPLIALVLPTKGQIDWFPVLHPLSQFIIRQILVSAGTLPPLKRAQIIEYWIRVSHNLLADFGDFYGWQCVTRALSYPPICRLSESWKLVSLDLVQKYSESIRLSREIPAERISLPVVGDMMAKLFQHSITSLDEEEKGFLKPGLIALSRFRRQPGECLDTRFHRKLQDQLPLLQPEEDIQSWIKGFYTSNILMANNIRIHHSEILANVFESKSQEKETVDMVSLSTTFTNSYMDLSLNSEPAHHYPLKNPTKYQLQYVNYCPVKDLQFFIEVAGGEEQVAEKSQGSKKAFRKKTQSMEEKIETNLPDENSELVFKIGSNDGNVVVSCGSLGRLVDLLLHGIEHLPEFKISVELKQRISQFSHEFDKSFHKVFVSTLHGFTTSESFILELRKKLRVAHKKLQLHDFRPILKRALSAIRLWMGLHGDELLDVIGLANILERELKDIEKLCDSDENQAEIKGISNELDRRRLLPATYFCRRLIALPASVTAISVSNSPRFPVIDIDQISTESICDSLLYYMSALMVNISRNEWIQFVDLIQNSREFLTVEINRFTNHVKSINSKLSEHGELSLPETLLMTSTLSLLYCPTKFEISTSNYSASEENLSSPAQIKKQVPVSLGVQSEGVSPLITLLPISIQRLLHFETNLSLWIIHQIITASSNLHRINRIKNVLEIAKLCRVAAGKCSVVLKSILSGLASPQCRIFGKAWAALSQIPVDGVDLKASKVDMEPFEAAETYVELFDTLWTEIGRQEANDKNSRFQLEYFMEEVYKISFRSPDFFLVHESEEGRIRLDPALIYDNMAPNRGISAGSSLPLINFEKRIQLFNLIDRLSTICESIDLEDSQPDVNLGFLCVPDYISSNDAFLTDFETAVRTFYHDEETSRIAKSTKIKSFARIIDIEKERFKVWDKDTKKIADLLDKDRARRALESNRPKTPDESSRDMINLKSPSFSRLFRAKLPKSSTNNLSPSPLRLFENKLSSYRSVPLLTQKKEVVEAANKNRPSSAVTPTQATSTDHLKTDPRYAKLFKVVSLVNSKTSIATDYTKRINVFRLLTEDEQEILLQAISKEDMYDWVSKINKASNEAVKNIEEGFETRVNQSLTIGSPIGSSSTTDSEPKKSSASRSTKSKAKLNTENPKFARSFGIPFLDILLREIKEREEIQAKGIVPSQKSTVSTQWWKRTAATDANTSYLSIKPADIEHVTWSEENSIPVILEKCLAEVERRGVMETGIYRLSGSSNLVQELKKAFDLDPHSVDLSHHDYGDINAVTGVVKLWLRELPEPLITFELFYDFMNASDLPEYDDRMIAIKDLVYRLPAPNFYCLKRFIGHLHLITCHEETNHMYASNLAIVFGPTLLKPPPENWSTDQNVHQTAHATDNVSEKATQINQKLNNPLSAEVVNTMKHLGKCNSIVKNIILQYHWIFDIERDDLETDGAHTNEDSRNVEIVIDEDFDSHKHEALDSLDMDLVNFRIREPVSCAEEPSPLSGTLLYEPDVGVEEYTEEVLDDVNLANSTFWTNADDQLLRIQEEEEQQLYQIQDSLEMLPAEEALRESESLESDLGNNAVFLTNISNKTM